MLLDDAALAAYDSTKALDEILNPTARSTGLEAIKLARRRQRGARRR